MKIEVEALAESDLMISAHAGTAGNHKCLSFIPGATLLGVVASRLYDMLSRDESWLVFHSGLVRFGDLRPRVGGEKSWSVPRSWHHDKGGSPKGAAGLDSEKIWDFSATNHGFFDRDEKQQPKAMREGFVSRSGRMMNPETRVSVKTARDPASGRSLEGALFSYEAIEAGTKFSGHVEFDESVPEPLVERVRKALVGSARVGGSRSAEFGAIKISSLSSHGDESVPEQRGKVLTILLVSELAAMDEVGLPCLDPGAEFFGLPKTAKLLPAQSFVGWRRYRPFNARRRRPDLERSVLQAGSVFSFELEQELEVSAMVAIQNRRYGLHQQDGLGEILVNPSFVGHPKPKFCAVSQGEAARSKVLLPEGDLAQWARRRANLRLDNDSGRELGKDLEKQLRLARKQLGTGSFPGPAQWSQIRQIVDNAAGLNELESGLTELFDGGVSQLQWGAEIWLNNAKSSLADVIRSSVRGKSFAQQRQALLYAAKSMDRLIHSHDGELSKA